MDTINTKVAALVKSREILNTLMGPILIELKDQSIPLEDRWNAYLQLVSGNVLTDIQSYGDGWVEDLDSSWTLYDTFYLERHETLLYPDMLERIQDDFFDGEVPDEEVINAWKEKVLASGYAGFEHDW